MFYYFVKIKFNIGLRAAVETYTCSLACFTIIEKSVAGRSSSTLAKSLRSWASGTHHWRQSQLHKLQFYLKAR